MQIIASHYLNQRWSNLMTHICVTPSQSEAHAYFLSRMLISPRYMTWLSSWRHIQMMIYYRCLCFWLAFHQYSLTTLFLVNRKQMFNKAKYVSLTWKFVFIAPGKLHSRRAFVLLQCSQQTNDQCFTAWKNNLYPENSSLLLHHHSSNSEKLWTCIILFLNVVNEMFINVNQRTIAHQPNWRYLNF